MTDTSDVVIVGGGVAGCAVAYYLARSGIASTIIEREGIGAKASGYSAGGLNPLEGAEIPGALAAMAMTSFRMHKELWDDLAEVSGTDFSPKVISVIRIAFDDQDVKRLEETHQTFESADDGFSSRWLSSDQLSEIDPRITSESVAAIETYGNAIVSSYRYTQALARAAEKLGAVVRPGEVTGVKKSGGRVTSVVTDDGEVACGSVVFATGPWSSQIERWLGIMVPVEPLKGEILRMKPRDGRPLDRDVQGAGVTLFHREGGQIWMGSTEERTGFNLEPSVAARDRLMAGAVRIMPAMSDAELLQHTACLRPVTPDWLPILGRATGWDNVYLATGAGKKGLLLSPGIGKGIADLISAGSTDVPLQGFEPDRFSD